MMLYKLLFMVLGLSVAFELKCPEPAQWSLRSRLLCSNSALYYCLLSFDGFTQTNTENCSQVDFGAPGSKVDFEAPGKRIVIRGNIDSSSCSKDKYQPIKYWTNVSSDCLFSVSNCTDEGQMLYRGDPYHENDNSCICDGAKGYFFVTEPKNRCFCLPSEEDCSCYKNICAISTSPHDNKCIEEILKPTLEHCTLFNTTRVDTSKVITQILPKTNKIDNKDTSIHGENGKTSAVAVLIVIIILFCMCLVLLFYESPMDVRINEYYTDEMPTAIQHLSEEDKALYIDIIKSGTETRYYLRINIIGENGVGKTCLLRRLLKQSTTGVQSTDGIDIHRCKIRIRDGEWIFNEEYINFWLDTIHSCSAQEVLKEETKTEFLYPPAIIVCTRIDECRDNLQERKDIFRKQLLSVFRNEAKKKHVRDICYVSNTQSGEEDFKVLRNKVFMYGKQMKRFAEQLPLRWIILEQSIDVLRQVENIISWEDIVKLSLQCSINSQDEIQLFLKYQHKVGGIIYFESLKEYIILNQTWLANAFMCLVSDKFDSNLKLTDEWRALVDTGKLAPALIVRLFDKEPQLDFNKHSGHLLNVMEIFGIIVKLTTLAENGQRNILPTYYMPCMISEKASVTEIVDRFNAKKDHCKRTPWLFMEFDFMPFDIFNHILCYYISKYAICIEPQTGRMAIYHGMGVFFLDNTKFRKFILCFCKNTIALQIWQWEKLERGKCKAILEELKTTTEVAKKRFEPRSVSYTVKSKCSDGNIHLSAGRYSYSEFLTFQDEYFCEDHHQSHSIQDFFQTWFEDYTEKEDVKTPSRKFKDTDLRGIVNAKEFKDLLSKGSYESFWNRIYLAGACNVGKTTLASLLIGEDIPKQWRSTDGLRIYFGRNGIDLKTKKMIPVRKVSDQGRHAVLANVLRGKPEMHMPPSKTPIQSQKPVTSIAPKVKMSSPPVAAFIPQAVVNSSVRNDSPNILKETITPHRSGQVEKENEAHKLTSMPQFSTIHEAINEELRKGEYKVKVAPSDLVDFGGQRSYDMTHQLFIQSKGAFTLLFDGRKGLRDTLDEYPQGNITTESILKHWVDSILTYCSDRDDDDDILPVILFVATHGDMLTEDERLQKTEEFKEVLNKLFSNHNQRHRIKYNDIYFINGRDEDDLEVDRLKAKYVEIAFQQKSWGNKMPMSWVPLELQLSDMRTSNICIVSKDMLIDLNQKSADLALTEKQLDQFLKAQHAFGKILYFEGVGLEKYVIVQPTTLVDILRSFITDEMFWPKDKGLQTILKELRDTGMIKKEDLFTLWSQPEFSLHMPYDDLKEFVMKVLIHLDLLVEPKRFEKTPCQNVFLVPCIIKRLPPADFMKDLKNSNAICLSYKLLKSSIPSALSFKLIAAALNVWSLKKSKDGICLYHKAAIFFVDELNEIYLLVKDDRVLVYFVNKSSKEIISKHYASSAQECLTLAMTSSLEFYYNSFGKFVPKSAVSDLFYIEVGEICDTRTCCILLTDAKKEKVWKCEAGKNHSTVYPLYWVHDVKDVNYKDGNCNVDCPGPSKCFLSPPTDKHLARLAGHIKIKSLELFAQTLGLSCDDWECLEHKHKGLPPQNMRIDALCEWKKKKEKPVYQDLYTALEKIGCDPHILCQIFKEDSMKRVDIHDVTLQEVPNDETLWKLSRNIGNCVHHLGIELGISFVEIEETINRYNKDMFEQNYDILLKWKKLSHVNNTIGDLMSVLKIVDLRGYTFLKEKYNK